MTRNDIDCPPWAIVAPLRGDETIIQLAARANVASNAYRIAMEAREPYPVVVRIAGTLARAVDALTGAIADSVATGDGRLA